MASTPAWSSSSAGRQNSGSMRSTQNPRRSSYNARQNPSGTILREADWGTGMDTVRPVKRVDAAGSLRLATVEHMGSLRKTNAPPPQPAPP